MLQVRDLHYTVADRQLLSGINWVIRPGRHSALVGPNGTGKTTLLKILIGDIEPLRGTVSKPKDYRIGYLPQEEIRVGTGTVLQTILDGQLETASLARRIEALHQALNTATENQENLLKQLGVLEQRYQALDGYQLESLARSILTSLGFSKSDFSRPLSEFSGGFQMRVYLALLLVQKPDLLLLDEPTNHLDLPSLEWLEQYLLNFPGSIVLVSHDRFFIDRLAQEIVELEHGQLDHYPGNYHAYEEQKEQRRILLEKRRQAQQEERARQQRFINRYRSRKDRAAQVQSRIKQLGKMEEIELPPPPARINFKLTVDIKSYKEVLKIENTSFRYGADSPWVLQNIDLNIFRGDRIALVGANGSGKTTLTRLMVGQLKPQQGSMQSGDRVIIGYYAQHQVEALNIEATIYDEVASSAAAGLVPRIRDVLGVFQFSGSDVFKKIKVLSGGEKARVSLAKILFSSVNFLIMDEPTTHLDKTAREALEDALCGYDGSLLVISHDRYFLDKLVHKVIELKEGRLEEYQGNYSLYLEKRQVQALVQPAAAPGVKENLPKILRSGKKTKEQKRLEAEARQAVSKELNRLKKEIEVLEENISKLETRITEIETLMAKPETYDDKKMTVSLQKEYAGQKKELEQANQRWEEAQLKLAEIESHMPGKSQGEEILTTLRYS